MSIFLRHKPCPSCGSRDNVGVYSDGHEWCFGGCGYYVAPIALKTSEEVRDWLKQKEKNVIIPALPSDCVYILPSGVERWLKSYGITEREITINRFQWSQSHERLIYPVFDGSGNLLMWQGRAFGRGEDGKKPRFYTAGSAEKTDHVLYHGAPLTKTDEEMLLNPTSVVVVEDLISCIMVSRLKPTLPLWGSGFNLSRMKRLSWRFERLFIWLDADKHHTAMRQAIKARPYFNKVMVVHTPHDPKYYSVSDASLYLTEALVNT